MLNLDETIKEELNKLIEIEGIEGHGNDGTNIVIYISDNAVKSKIPKELDNIKIITNYIGKVQLEEIP